MSDYSEYKAKNVSELYENFIRKETKSVQHKDGLYVVDFGTTIVGQGVVFPDNLGFEPKEGMKAIWDSGDSLGSIGDLSFYDKEGKLLCALHCDRPTLDRNWKDCWSNVTPNAEAKSNLDLSDKELELPDVADREIAESFASIKKRIHERKHDSTQADISYEDLMPASKVLYRALMEGKHPDHSEATKDYLLKAEKVLRGEETVYSGWSKYLAEEYKRMQKENILGEKGEILDPKAFASSKFFRSGKCHVAGLTEDDLGKTREFEKLKQQESGEKIKKNHKSALGKVASLFKGGRG